MTDYSHRTTRQVSIADHLWDSFELMAEQMGSEREALINQALFTFARLNGFLEARHPVEREQTAEPGVRAPSPPLAHSGPPVPTPLPARPPVRSAQDEHTPRPQPAPSRSTPTEPPFPEPETGAPREAEQPDPGAQKREYLERKIAQKLSAGALPTPGVEKYAGATVSDGVHLYLMTESGELDKITKERFVIGRGKHCDFVIDSGKVSREHAVIVREGDAFFIEDLGSSNGTWFNKQRIKRRKIEEGDEYFVCNEKIKLVLR